MQGRLPSCGIGAHPRPGISLGMLLSAAAAAMLPAPGGAQTFAPFQKVVLTTDFVGEGPSVGDFNKDGKLDMAAGAFYWAGPAFTAKSKFSANGTETYSVTTYAKHYMGLPGYDFDGDGWDDIVYTEQATGAATWEQNPKGGTGTWKKFTISSQTGSEAACFRALFPDGKPKLLMANSQRYIGWSEPGADPTQPWTFHAVGSAANKYPHGLGAGDVNGDGRIDILVADGWYEQPASLTGDPAWAKHDVIFGTSTRGGAQMYTEDLDGDGDADVVTSLDGHGWGLAWCEQVKTGGEISFTTHTIMGNRTDEAKYGAAFSELHSLGLADLDGDGLKDLVSGKRWYAHNGTMDPEPEGTPVLYAFKQVRSATGTTFQPFLIDSTSGSGCSLETRDLNGDGYPDLAINSKKGGFVFLSKDRPPLALIRPAAHRTGSAFTGLDGRFFRNGMFFDLRGARVNAAPAIPLSLQP